MTSRYRCDALTNWAMKQMMLGVCQLYVLMFPCKRWMWWMSYKTRSCERNLCNCVRSPKKFGTSTGFEPVTLVRCSNWAMKPLMLGAGQLNVHPFPWKTSSSKSQGSLQTITRDSCPLFLKWQITLMIIIISFIYIASISLAVLGALQKMY